MVMFVDILWSHLPSMVFLTTALNNRNSKVIRNMKETMCALVAALLNILKWNFYFYRFLLCPRNMSRGQNTPQISKVFSDHLVVHCLWILSFQVPQVLTLTDISQLIGKRSRYRASFIHIIMIRTLCFQKLAFIDTSYFLTGEDRGDI